MLADVGMVKTYLKSAHVNDLGFAWTGPPCCMDRPSSLFLRFFRQEVLPCMYTLHHPYICPCFGGNIFTHPCFSTFYGMQITHGPVNF